MITLDALDRKIISILQKDGDLSHAKLAERVGASSASCWRRIKSLENSGVLGETVRLVTPSSVGKDVNVFCQIKVASQDPASRKDFEKLMRTRDEVMECYSMSGEWDYLLRVVTSDILEFEAFLMSEILSHPSVESSSSLFALNRVKYTTAIPL